MATAKDISIDVAIAIFVLSFTLCDHTKVMCCAGEDIKSCTDTHKGLHLSSCEVNTSTCSETRELSDHRPPAACQPKIKAGS